MADMNSSYVTTMSDVCKWNVPPAYSNAIREFINTTEVKISRHQFRYHNYLHPETADLELKQVANSDDELREYFQHRNIPILNGSDYNSLSSRPVIIGAGKFGYTEVCCNVTNGSLDLVAVKTVYNRNGYSLARLLREFMYQEKAHNALRGNACTAPKPLGFLRIIHSTDQVLSYALASEFCSVIPYVGIGMTLEQACIWNTRFPSIATEEWRDICFALIEAVKIFRSHGIFHLDIKTDNIMLHFPQPNTKVLPFKKRIFPPPGQNVSEESPRTRLVQVMIIDYGFAQSGNRHSGFPCTPEEHPHLAPELCLYKSGQYGGMGVRTGMQSNAVLSTQCSDATTDVLPHSTSDVHSVAFVISTIAKHLKMEGLFYCMKDFMRKKPEYREIDFVKSCVEQRFKNII